MTRPSTSSLVALALTVAAAACSKVEAEYPAPAPSMPAPARAPAPAAAPSRGPEHAVFSLIDNRLLAHVQRGGGIVALAGSVGFTKYLGFGRPNLPWELGQELEGRKVALGETYTRVNLPLGSDQAGAARALYVRVHSPGARAVEVKVNAHKAGQVPVAAGWQTVTVPLPAGAARVGENEVRLIWTQKKVGRPAVEWIQLGGEPPPEGAPAWWDRAARALVLPAGGGLVWYVQVPKDGRVVGDVSPGCEVTVQARAHAGGAVTGALRGDGSAVELKRLAGSVVRLELGTAKCPEARLTNAALVVPGPAPKVRRPARPKNVVFWIMDSLRADKLRPFHEGARAEVPNWEALAKEATVFRAAYVQGNESRVSHASLWSALYPAVHRMIGAKAVLPAKLFTLGEGMKEAGLFTTGVTTNGWVVKKWGFGDGWDAYRNHIHDGGGTRGGDILREATASLEKKSANPFFLYLGTVDTHVSWRAHEPWISKYDPGYEGRFKKAALGPDIEKIATGKLSINDRDKQRVVALYDSAVSYQDDLLGQLRAKLAAWGVGADTMIVITADHGEEFWEDGRLGHGASLRETLVHVPLLVHYPPLFPAGIVEEGVDTVDLLPTFLDALGRPIPEDLQGESLLPLAQGVGRGYPRPSFASQYEDAWAMRLGGWKLLVRGAGSRLYHAAKDPLEKEEVTEARPLEHRFVTDAMSLFVFHMKDWRKARWGVASNASPRFADEVER